MAVLQRHQKIKFLLIGSFLLAILSAVAITVFLKYGKSGDKKGKRSLRPRDTNPIKTEDPNNTETRKTEEPKTEPPKKDGSKPEEPNTEALKKEGNKTEEPKTKAPKKDGSEEPKTEPPKRDGSKPEEPKTEPPKKDGSKTEEPKTEASIKDGSKTEVPETKAPKETAEEPGVEHPVLPFISFCADALAASTPPPLFPQAEVCIPQTLQFLPLLTPDQLKTSIKQQEELFGRQTDQNENTRNLKSANIHALEMFLAGKPTVVSQETWDAIVISKDMVGPELIDLLLECPDEDEQCKNILDHFRGWLYCASQFYYPDLYNVEHPEYKPFYRRFYQAQNTLWILQKELPKLSAEDKLEFRKCYAEESLDCIQELGRKTGKAMGAIPFHDYYTIRDIDNRYEEKDRNLHPHSTIRAFLLQRDIERRLLFLDEQETTLAISFRKPFEELDADAFKATFRKCLAAHPDDPNKQLCGDVMQAYRFICIAEIKLHNDEAMNNFIEAVYLRFLANYASTVSMWNAPNLKMSREYIEHADEPELISEASRSRMYEILRDVIWDPFVRLDTNVLFA